MGGWFHSARSTAHIINQTVSTVRSAYALKDVFEAIAAAEKSGLSDEKKKELEDKAAQMVSLQLGRSPGPLADLLWLCSPLPACAQGLHALFKVRILSSHARLQTLTDQPHSTGRQARGRVHRAGGLRPAPRREGPRRGPPQAGSRARDPRRDLQRGRQGRALEPPYWLQHAWTGSAAEGAVRRSRELYGYWDWLSSLRNRLYTTTAGRQLESMLHDLMGQSKVPAVLRSASAWRAARSSCAHCEWQNQSSPEEIVIPQSIHSLCHDLVDLCRHVKAARQVTALVSFGHVLGESLYLEHLALLARHDAVLDGVHELGSGEVEVMAPDFGPRHKHCARSGVVSRARAGRTRTSGTAHAGTTPSSH